MSIDFTIEINDQDFRDRLEKLDQTLQDSVQGALMQAANAIVLRARQLVHVRTGYLQSTIYGLVVRFWSVQMGAFASYAIFQELSTRFLSRALQEILPQLPSYISEAIQRSFEEASA